MSRDPRTPPPTRRPALAGLALFLVCALWGRSLPAAEARPGAGQDLVHLVFLHTNDVHGQVLPREATWLREEGLTVGGLPRLAAYIERQRDELRGKDEQGRPYGLFAIDAGDWYQGTPEGALNRGLDFFEAQVRIRYDAMCVGNHDFDHGLENLRRILKRTEAPAVLANVLEPGGGPAAERRLDWVVPYRIVERAGVRVAFVGLLSTVTPEITHDDARGLEFAAPAETLTVLRAELAGRADLVVPLTHLGILDDQLLAQAHPDLPLIVGGHSHTFLRSGMREGSTLIVQAGGKASAVGVVDLVWDRRAGRVVELSARLHDLDEEPAEAHRNPEVEARCREIVTHSQERMDQVVGELSGPLDTSRLFESSSAGNWISDLFRAAGGADVAIHNRGGIRKRIPAGPVTRRDLFEILPFDNTLVTLELTGGELFEGVRRAVEGSEHAGIEVSGMVLRVREREDGGGELVAVLVGGKPVQPGATYRLATNSFLAGGGDAYLDHLGPREVRDHAVLLRDLLERELLEQGVVTPPTENRYQVLSD